MNAPRSMIVLLGVNMIPVAGVVFFGWRVLDVMLLYWAENVVIGFINVFRMALAKDDRGTGDPRTDQALRIAIAADPERWETAHKRVRRDRKITMIPFFILHYGVFCAVHLMFLSYIFDQSKGVPAILLSYDAGAFAPGLQSMVGYDFVPVLIGIVPIAASHLFSFFANFIGKGEYRRTTAKELMHRPYGRVAALHVAILIGGMLVHTIGGQAFLLVILVLVKTVVDAKFHAGERDAFAKAGQDARH